MKKVITLALVLLVINASYAQEDGEQVFKKFKADISLGYALPQGSGVKGGFLFVIEPKYAVIQQLSVGLRIESAILVNDVATDVNTGNSGKAKSLQSYLATGDYYFTNNKFRPFVGGGAGIFSVTSYLVLNSNAAVLVPAKSKFGFMARGGFEAGHFRLGLEYNFLSEKDSYLGIKVGACIGGGRKQNNL